MLQGLPCNDARCVAAGIGQLAWVGLAIGDQLGDRSDRYGRVDEQHEGEAPNPGDRREVLYRVVGDTLIETWGRRMWAVRAHEQRMAIRCRPRDLSGPDGPIGSLLVLDHDGLLECCAERLRNSACDYVCSAPGAKWNDNRDWFRWIIVGVGS